MSRYSWYAWEMLVPTKTHPIVPEEENSLELAPIVISCVTRLKDKDEGTQKKGVKVLVALAWTCEHISDMQRETTNGLDSGR